MDIKTIVREYLELVWNRGDLAALDRLTTDEFEYYLGGQPPRGRAEMKRFLQSMRIAFPDWHVEIDDCFAQGPMVAIRWRGHATHQGPFHGIPPTGKRIQVSGINVYQLAGERVAVEWEQMDSLSMLSQLGALQKPG